VRESRRGAARAANHGDDIAVCVVWRIIHLGDGAGVWVFVGDMTYETGGFHECYKYAKNMKLPIKFIVEDNSMSTNTDTRVAWGGTQTKCKNVIYYKYKRKYPHHGTGKWILF
jgi:TPP-dependent pyruvate/acetoin dehydrogenase alpha subunit